MGDDDRRRKSFRRCMREAGYGVSPETMYSAVGVSREEVENKEEEVHYMTGGDDWEIPMGSEMTQEGKAKQHRLEIIRFWVARGCIERSQSVLAWIDEKKKMGQEVRTIMPYGRKEIPHSELAIHSHAAGQGIVLAGCTLDKGEPYYCKMVFEMGQGRCELIEGLASELLPHELRTKLSSGGKHC